MKPNLQDRHLRKHPSGRAAMLATSLAALLALSACAPAAPPQVDLAPRCGAANLQGLIGQDGAVIEEIGVQGPLRVMHPGDAVTTDYRPDRLNIEIGADGLIVRVWCS